MSIAIGKSDQNIENGFAENHEALGTNAYGKSKAAQYRLAKHLAGELDLKVYYPRTFNILGPGLPEKWVAGRLCNQLISSKELVLGNLQAQRDFLDIRDVVCAYCDLVESG